MFLFSFFLFRQYTCKKNENVVTIAIHLGFLSGKIIYKVNNNFLTFYLQKHLINSIEFPNE